jgi:hypothetical protein
VNITIPLWVLPLPIIVLAILDWALEQARKLGAGRSKSRTGRLGRPNGEGTTATAGTDTPRVTILAHSRPFDQDAA